MWLIFAIAFVVQCYTIWSLWRRGSRDRANTAKLRAEVAELRVAVAALTDPAPATPGPMPAGARTPPVCAVVARLSLGSKCPECEGEIRREFAGARGSATCAACGAQWTAERGKRGWRRIVPAAASGPRLRASAEVDDQAETTMISSSWSRR